MSQTKFAGVPSHAYYLFFRLRDAVNEGGGKGERWSEALKALLDTDDPIKAKRILEMEKVFSGTIPGVISAVTSQGNAGVVRLKTPFENLQVGVISTDTQGRIPFMNQQKDGKLKPDTPVVITRWQKGPEALRILELATPESIKDEMLLDLHRSMRR